MRIGRVIGMVTLSRKHPSLVGGRFKVVVPLMLDDLVADRLPDQEELVAFDDWNTGHGELVAFSEGREAAQPYYPDLKPLDTNITAILDTIDVAPVEQLAAD